MHVLDDNDGVQATPKKHKVFEDRTTQLLKEHLPFYQDIKVPDR